MVTSGDTVTRSAFDAALTAAETALARPDADPASLAKALSAIRENRPAEIDRPMLARVFSIAYRILGLDETLDRAPVDRRLFYTATDLIETSFSDHLAQHRNFTNYEVRRQRGLNRPAREGAPRDPVPLAHAALTRAEAAELAAPYLRHLEKEIADHPTQHFALCWQVMQHPLPPWQGVFADWLDDIDRRGLGLGRSNEALERALALRGLADDGRQKLSWKNCEETLLPQLQDPHPLIAINAARFLGSLMSDPETKFTGRSAPPLRQVLEHLRGLPIYRSRVAGGFVDGIYDHFGRYLDAFRAIEGFDTEAWVLDILALEDEEPYLPGAQAFWFFLHEEYCADPGFVSRLIDAGHAWIAMMCATEIQGKVDGMQPVLSRLSESHDAEIAQQSARWLDLFYRDAP